MMIFQNSSLSPKLNQPWRTRRGDTAEVRAVARVGVRQIELGVVEGIEEFAAELEPGLLSDGKRKVFCKPRSQLLMPGPVDRIAPGVAEIAHGGRSETRGIEVDEAIGAQIAGETGYPRRCRSGSRGRSSIHNAGGIRTENGERETRSKAGDPGQVPAADEEISGGRHIGAKSLPRPSGNVVNGAQNHAMRLAERRDSLVATAARENLAIQQAGPSGAVGQRFGERILRVEIQTPGGAAAELGDQGLVGGVAVEVSAQQVGVAWVGRSAGIAAEIAAAPAYAATGSARSNCLCPLDPR